MKPSALVCLLFAATAGACVASPEEIVADSEVTSEIEADELAALRAMGVAVAEPIEVCEAQTELERSADEVVCGGMCEDQDSFKSVSGCANLKGPALQACLEGLCATAKDNYDDEWPDGPPACPATNGACESPVDPSVKGTCTKETEGDFARLGWVVDGCTVSGDYPKNGYTVYFGSYCTYSCIKDPPPPPPPTPITPTPTPVK